MTEHDDRIKHLIAGLSGVEAVRALMDNGELSVELGTRFIQEMTAGIEEEDK